MGALQRKALLEDVAALVHSGEWRFGEAIRFLRSVVLGRSRPAFAQLVGLSPAAVQQLEEREDANPTLDTMRRVLRPFGASVGLIFPRMELPEPPTDEVASRRAGLKQALPAKRRARTTA